MLQNALLIGAGLLLLFLGAGFAVRRRNQRLYSAAAAASLKTATGVQSMVDLIWQRQQVGGLPNDARARLRDVRGPDQAENLVQNLPPIDGRELAVLMARAEHVEDAARFVTLGASAAIPAADALLSQVGGLAALLPGAAMGVHNAQDVLDFLGIDFDILDSTVHAGLDLADGAVDHMMGGHVPLLTLISVTRKEMQMVSSGKSVAKALQHGALDVAASAGGAFVGLKAGALAGTFVAPGIGTVLGAVAGAFAGGLGGREAAFQIKIRPLIAANERLAQAALAAMPCDIATVHQHLADVVAQPAEQVAAQASGWASGERVGWRGVWPRFGDALDDLVAWRGEGAAEEAAARAADVQRALRYAGQTRYGPAGTAMVLLNCPVEAAACGVDAKTVESLVPLQRASVDLRRDLGMTV